MLSTTGVTPGQPFQRLLTGGGLTATGLARCGQAHLAVQHLAELLGGADIEGPPGRRIDRAGQLVQFLLHIGQKTAEGAAVDGDARGFHARQHRGERYLQVFVQGQQAVPEQAVLQQARHIQRQGGGAVAPRQARAPAHGQPGPAVVVLFRIEQIGGDAQIHDPRLASLPQQAPPPEAFGVVAHHQRGLRQIVGQLVRLPCPASRPGRHIVRGIGCRHGQMRRRVLALRPDEGQPRPCGSRELGRRTEQGRQFFRGRGGHIQQAQLLRALCAGGGGVVRRKIALSGAGGLRRACRSGRSTSCPVPAQQGIHFPPQSKQFEFRGQGGAGFGVGRPDGHVVQADVRAEIPAQCGQFAPGEHVFQMVAQFFLELGRDPLEMVADLLQRGAAFKYLLRLLGADARHAGDIVAGIAYEGLHVGPLRGLHAGLPHEILGGRRAFPRGSRGPT